VSILADERATYDEAWASIQTYGNNSPGEQFLPLFLQMVGDTRGTLLDAGTGSGKGAVALQRAGFTVCLCDVTDAGLIPDARALTFKSACLSRGFGGYEHCGFARTTFDYVYCCDVLEHMPPQFTMLAVEQMLRITKRLLFLSVSLSVDVNGAWIGKRLHQTVEPFTWWRDSLSELGRVVEARDLLDCGVFLVERKTPVDEPAGCPA
jgi:ubiquinone/menaquinone biosynthesis C-methylase UbiE